MSSAQLNFEYDVRIPDALVQQWFDGEITCAMLNTMVILYKWADWSTGRVRWVSSRGLDTASHHAYSDRTFRVSLQRLEEMGWITRHMTPGSRKNYAVTISNYKVVDDAGKVRILNPRDIRASDPYKINPCREGSHEASHEASQEGSHITSLNNEPNLLPGPEPDNEGQSVCQSVNHGGLRPHAAESEEKVKTSKASGAQAEANPKPAQQDFVEFDGPEAITAGQLTPEHVALRNEIGGNTELVQLLGLPYLFADHRPELNALAVVLHTRQRTGAWLAAMLRWVKRGDGREAKFWQARIHTGTRGLRQLAKHAAKGELCQQFDSHLAAAGEHDPFIPGNSTFVPPEPGGMEEVMERNRARAAAGEEG